MATVETVKIVFDVESKELTDTTKQLVDLGKVVDDDAAKFKKLNAEAGNSEKAFTSLRTQVKQAKDEVVRLSDEFGEFSAEANAARARAGQLADQMSDLNRQVNLLNPEAKAKAFVNFGQGVVGAFQVATGALQAFGAENEEVQKIAMRLQGALNVVQGIASIKQLKEAYQDVKVVLGVTTAAQNVLTTATTAGGVAATGAATATRGFTAALLANPFTAIAVAIGAVAGAFLLLRDNTKDATKETSGFIEKQKTLAKLTDQLVRAEEDLAIAKDPSRKAEILKARAAREGAEAMADQVKEQERLSTIISTNNAKNQQAQALIDRLKTSNRESAIFQIQSLQKAIDQRNKETAEANKQLKVVNEILKTKNKEVEVNKQLIDLSVQKTKEESKPIQIRDKSIVQTIELKDSLQAVLDLQKQINKELNATAPKYVDIKTSAADLNKDLFEKEDALRQIRLENISFFSDLVQSSVDIYQTGLDEQTQSEIESLEARKEAGLITEEAYQAGLKKIRQKNAEDTKKFQIFAGILNAAQAILAALNTPPNPLDPTAQIRAVAFASVLSAANLAKIVATPLPKFKKGTLNFQGGNMDSDGGALAILHPNEAVIPADRNRAYHPTLEAIYKKQIKPSELNAFVLNKLAGKGSIGRDTEITASIDTYALSRAIGKNKTVHLGNAEAVGNVIAKKLLGAYNIRR